MVTTLQKEEHVGNQVLHQSEKRRRKPKFHKRPRFNPAHNSNQDRNRPLSRGLEVRVDYRGDSEEERTKALDKALSRLKKEMMKEGVIQQMKDRQYFVSPSRKRYLKRKQAAYKRKVKGLKKKKSFRRRQ